VSTADLTADAPTASAPTATMTSVSIIAAVAELKGATRS